MKVRLHHKDLEEALLVNHYPDRFASTDDGGITERVFAAELIGGQGSYREIFMENIHIGYGDISTGKYSEMYFETDTEMVEMHFAIKGKTYAQERNTKEIFQFDYNQHNIVYVSQFQGRSFFNTNQHFKVFEVNLLPDFFKRFLPEEEQSFFQFLKAMDRRENRMLSPHNYPITTEMHWIIQDILNCDRKRLYKRLFLEAKVTELLLLQLEQISSLQQPNAHSLKKSEIERMHAVKDFLNHHLHEPHTLWDLARLFGTNEYKLKKSFKAVFGTTVFNYWNTVKMQHAKQKLLDGNVTISEVADQIGYKNPQHFTTAFKKRFGYPPSRFKG
ncbi:MAG: AraC family transcriptional regulator [Bacteroidota bacterium]